MKGKLLLLVLSCFLASAAQSQLITRNFLHLGSNRIYDLELPSNWTPGAKLPLLMDLHYLGGDARDQDTLSRFFPIADTAGFIICHPWGQGTNWNVGFNTPYSSGAPDVDFISTVIDSIDAEFGVDRQRVYVTGMGQGGFMAHRLACELSDEIAAVACVGGSITDSAVFYCSPNRPVPVMIIHGTADSVVPYAGNPGFWPGVDDVINLWLDKNGCPGTMPVSTPLPDPANDGSSITAHRYSCTATSEVLLYEVSNGGFSWPGSSINLPNGGIINQDINGSEEIWKFLRRWKLDGTTSAPEQLSRSWMTAHPNPVTSTLQLEYPTLSRSGTLFLAAPDGKVLVSKHLKAGSSSTSIDMSELPAGIYLLRMQAGNQVSTARIVRQ